MMKFFEWVLVLAGIAAFVLSTALCIVHRDKCILSVFLGFLIGLMKCQPKRQETQLQDFPLD